MPSFSGGTLFPRMASKNKKTSLPPSSAGNGRRFITPRLADSSTAKFIRLMIDLLTAEEKVWLNEYHKNVYDIVAPHLNDEEREWLKEYTREI